MSRDGVVAAADARSFNIKGLSTAASLSLYSVGLDARGSNFRLNVQGERAAGVGWPHFEATFLDVSTPQDGNDERCEEIWRHFD
jgi:hypothetical protein